jgi:hypothetical protein
MKWILFSLLCVLCGCQTSAPMDAEDQIPRRVKLVQEIRSQVAYKLMREKGLIPFGSGGGAIDKIHMISLSFEYRKPLTIEEGRDLVLTAVHELIKAVNRDERIRPYLESYPFGPERIEVEIFVRNVKGERLPSSAATLVSCCNGICTYQIFHFDEKRFETILKETFAEAEARVQAHSLEMHVAQ